MSYAKYLLLVILLLFATSALGLAADYRYENIVMNDSVVAQFDKNTLRYEREPYRSEKLLSVWIKTTADFSSDYSLNHYLFRLTNREMLLLDTVECNGNGQILSKTSYPYNPNSWTLLLPETFPEACYVAALKYSQANNMQLEQDYAQRTTDSNKNRNFAFFTDIFNIFSTNN